jgi:hypothetical protein
MGNGEWEMGNGNSGIGRVARDGKGKKRENVRGLMSVIGDYERRGPGGSGMRQIGGLEKDRKGWRRMEQDAGGCVGNGVGGGSAERRDASSTLSPQPIHSRDLQIRSFSSSMPSMTRLFTSLNSLNSLNGPNSFNSLNSFNSTFAPFLPWRIGGE